MYSISVRYDLEWEASHLSKVGRNCCRSLEATEIEAAAAEAGDGAANVTKRKTKEDTAFIFGGIFCMMSGLSSTGRVLLRKVPW